MTSMIAVPTILKDLSADDVQAILTAYREDGIHPISLQRERVDRLKAGGYLRTDRDGWLVVTPDVYRALRLAERIR